MNSQDISAAGARPVNGMPKGAPRTILANCEFVAKGPARNGCTPGMWARKAQSALLEACLQMKADQRELAQLRELNAYRQSAEWIDGFAAAELPTPSDDAEFEVVYVAQAPGLRIEPQALGGFDVTGLTEESIEADLQALHRHICSQPWPKLEDHLGPLHHYRVDCCAISPDARSSVYRFLKEHPRAGGLIYRPVTEQIPTW